MTLHDGKTRTALACLALALLALAAFWQSLGFGFLDMDDHVYFADNPMVRNGFVDGSLGYAFGFDFSNWHPLTWLSLMLHAEVFGISPTGLRIENLVLHAGCAALLFLSLRAMTRRFWPSLLVAALFVVHPVNVENVAWITEHKTLLASFFGFAAIYRHALYVHRPSPWRYVAVSVCAMLSLLSKAAFVALPFLLLLLDVWPLGRFAPGEPVLPRLGRLALEKTPLLLMAAGLSMVYVVIAANNPTNTIMGSHSMGLRLANAVVCYIRYLDHLFRPTGLAFFYPFPTSIPMWQTLSAALVLAGTTILCLAQGRRRPWLAVGWLWYLGTMFPTIGLVANGIWPAMADRFLYLPSVGIYIMAAFGLAEAALTRPALGPWPAVGVAVATLTIMMVLTMASVPHWKSRKALARQALAVTDGNWFAHEAMGAALGNEGYLSLSESHLRRALEMKPQFVRAKSNLGKCLVGQKRYDEALDLFGEILETVGDKLDSFEEYMKTLQLAGRMDEAERRIRDILAQAPDDPLLLNNMGVALYRLKRYAQAEALFRETLDLDPAWIDPRVHLAGALFRQGHYDEAEAEVRRAMATEPDHPGALKLLPMIEKARPKRP